MVDASRQLQLRAMLQSMIVYVVVDDSLLRHLLGDSIHVSRRPGLV
jgi:hypothetical protein